MRAFSLRIAIIALCSAAACTGVCHAQAQPDAAGSGAAAGQSPQASGDSAAGAAPTAASQWTAGGTSFKSAGAWGTKQNSGTGGAASWTVGGQSFADRIQPGGIWRADQGGAVTSLRVPHAAQATVPAPPALPVTRLPARSAHNTTGRSAGGSLSRGTRTPAGGVKPGGALHVAPHAAAGAHPSAQTAPK